MSFNFSFLITPFQYSPFFNLIIYTKLLSLFEHVSINSIPLPFYCPDFLPPFLPFSLPSPSFPFFTLFPFLYTPCSLPFPSLPFPSLLLPHLVNNWCYVCRSPRLLSLLEKEGKGEGRGGFVCIHGDAGGGTKGRSDEGGG